MIEPAHAGQDVDEAAVAARELSGAERALVGDLVRQARAEGVALTGPDGLLKALTKTVLEAALQEEMTEHLGYDRHAAAGRGSGNSRNGSRNKKVITDACGQVEIAVPRDRNGTFEPVIVGKRKRRVTDVDRVVLSLYAKGLTTGEIAAHFADVYGVSVSKDTISRITDRVIEEMQAWWSRPLEKVYAAVFIDAIMVKIRDGQVRNRPVYAAIGVDLDGHKDILGMWAGEGDGESAKFLAGSAHRPAQSWGQRHLLPGLRRPQRVARQRVRGVPVGHGADLHHPSDPQHFPVCLPQVLGQDQRRPQADLHRSQCR